MSWSTTIRLGTAAAQLAQATRCRLTYVAFGVVLECRDKGRDGRLRARPLVPKASAADARRDGPAFFSAETRVGRATGPIWPRARAGQLRIEPSRCFIALAIAGMADSAAGPIFPRASIAHHRIFLAAPCLSAATRAGIADSADEPIPARDLAANNPIRLSFSATTKSWDGRRTDISQGIGRPLSCLVVLVLECSDETGDCRLGRRADLSQGLGRGLSQLNMIVLEFSDESWDGRLGSRADGPQRVDHLFSQREVVLPLEGPLESGNSRRADLS